MTIVIYYEKCNGKALFCMSGPDGTEFPYPAETESIIQLEMPVELPGYISGGRYVSVGTPPNPKWEFNYTSKQWEDPRTLEDFKEEARAKAKAARDATEFSPFTYNGMTFDGDLDAQRRLSVLASAAKSAIAAGYGFTKEFTLADNSVVQLTAEDFIGIEMTKLWQVDAAFQVYRAKKAAIEAATTLEELEAI